MICHLGHVDEMNKLLEDIAIFVLPSYREGFPKALIEAGVASCAIVTTDVPGCRDVILHGCLGVLIQPRSVKEIEVGISSLIDDAKKRLELSKSMEEYAKNHYSVQSVVSKHLEIYGSFLQ